MKLIKVAKKDKIKKLEEVQRLLGEVCEDLKKEGICSDAFSIKLDIGELIYQLSSSSE
jgi:hypothetical protein